MSVANPVPKRFSLSLPVSMWRQLADELLAMEQLPHLAAVPVEKRLERDRAGEQLQAIITSVLPSRDGRPDDTVMQNSLPLLRATAKYLLTACDRLRRAALQQAWQVCSRQATADAATPVSEDSIWRAALETARLWDRTMRELSTQHGVLHPLTGMVEPLPLGDAELQQLGLPSEDLLNGQDILAS